MLKESTLGQCCERNFPRFSPIFDEKNGLKNIFGFKNGVFLKENIDRQFSAIFAHIRRTKLALFLRTKVMIQVLQNVAASSTTSAYLFSQVFGENISTIVTTIPDM
jgi:AraC-like DNA-binding protein